MKILFISRAYPPVTGGIENQNYELSVWLQKVADTTTLANPYGKKFLLFFFPYVVLRVLLTAYKYDTILLGDGVLAPLGYITKFFHPKKTCVSVIHGLDVTFKNGLYQKWWVGHFIPSLDGLIAVSRETKELILAKNIPETKIVVVPNGINPETLQKAYSRTDLEKLLGKNLSGKHIVLTAGRLAKRKGVEWFIRNVLPHLPKSVYYVVAGAGIEEDHIRKAITDTQMNEKVLMLGRVSDTEKNILLNTADIFVQPNIHVDGDMEGFGITVIEASVCGRPIIASNIEGLKDALVQERNGILVESENAEAFTFALLRFLDNDALRISFGEKAKQYTQEHYHWNTLILLYIDALQSFIKNTL